jgi:hypothetical protein
MGSLYKLFEKNENGPVRKQQKKPPPHAKADFWWRGMRNYPENPGRMYNVPPVATILLVRGGESPMAKDVVCEVNSCKYWANGNLCRASSIKVTHHRGKQASNSEETDCRTFEPKV